MGLPQSSRRFLVCEPRSYAVHHVLNPWMTWDEEVEIGRAWKQWGALCAALEAAGAKVEVMPHTSRSGAMTFTRDVAVVVGAGEAILLRNVGRRGDLEPRPVKHWLRSRGYRVVDLPEADRLDGGNVVATTDGWLIGVPGGASRQVAKRCAELLAARTGRPVHGIPLASTRFAHLDTVLADLAGRAWLAHPEGFAQPDLRDPCWATVLRDRPVIRTSTDAAVALACNVVVVGECVIGGLTPPLCREIERVGLWPVPLDLDEFRKAGGGAHCLTLDLDPAHRPEDPVRPQEGRSSCPVP